MLPLFPNKEAVSFYNPTKGDEKLKKANILVVMFCSK